MVASASRALSRDACVVDEDVYGAMLCSDLLDEGDGATTVARLQEEIVALHGQPAVRATLAGTANAIGAKMRGK